MDTEQASYTLNYFSPKLDFLKAQSELLHSSIGYGHGYTIVPGWWMVRAASGQE
jgi:hypothetical protein